ncbi:MAG: hypothetical protein JO112_19995 [Planctomycetes bacterium]|nr:hypothetical protein [Planctomycetota bacterium]
MKEKLFIVFLLLVAFCGETVAGPTYTLNAKFATLERVGDLPSCGSHQLLHDTYELHDFARHTVKVNYTTWSLYTEEDYEGYTWYTVSFKAQPDAYTWIQMFLVANDRAVGGQLELHGRLPDRRECADKVEVLGYRD